MNTLQLLKKKELLYFTFVQFDPTKRNYGAKLKRNVIKYTDSIQLPKTTFPLWLNPENRINVDETILKEGCFNDHYNWQRENLKGKEFVLHDGPPYANGVPHMGHAINKILKDIINRQKVLQGVKVDYKPGWDCHGLPIEMNVLMGTSGKHCNPTVIRGQAKDFARRAIWDQKAAFKSWGIMANWEKNSYHTFDHSYITNQLQQFYNLFEKGLVYRDLKPVYWSPSAKTALAEAELEYNPTHKSAAITLRFKLIKSPPIIEVLKKEVYLLVWTTTPWTLPANQAIAYNPEYLYVLVGPDISGNNYIIARDLLQELDRKVKSKLKIITEFKGIELAGSLYEHPFTGKPKPLLPANYVTSEMGTGLVHTAPSHGLDDFLLGLKHKMNVTCLVDENGCFTAEAGKELDSLAVLGEGNEKVQEILSDIIIHKEIISHSYPYDWRTKQPVILRASKQWFLDTNAIKARAAEVAREVEVLPNRYKENLILQVEKRPYWCISRQRVWGVPIPVVYDSSDRPLLNRKLLDYYIYLLNEKGPDFWWNLPLDKLLPQTLCQKFGLQIENLQKGKDIFDIWMDSGLSWSAVLQDQVADLYLEGIDQFTGWFQSSLLTSVALKDRAPYKKILTHGFAVDDKGQKMSKSIGNVVDPQEIVQGAPSKKKTPFGIDVLRWWVAAHSLQHANVPVTSTTLKNSSDSIHKLRNTLRFMLGCLKDFPDNNNFDLSIIDYYILHKIHQFYDEINQTFSTFQFNKTCSTLINFAVNELSGFYFHIIKDRLYCDEPNSSRRRAAQSTLKNILEIFSCSLAPILPVLVEEVFFHHPLNYEKTPFFLQHHQKLDTSCLMDREKVYQAIEQALLIKSVLTKEIPVNCSSLQMKCEINASAQVLKCLRLLQEQNESSFSDLADILQVSKVLIKESNHDVNFRVKVEVADGFLCGRCKKHTSSENGNVCGRCSEVLSLTNKT